MKKISIDSDSRRLNVSSIVVGYSEENKTEKIEFIIPDKYKEFGKKACFNANGKIFAKIFDDINGSTLTFTRDITKYKELEMSIEFFKIENEDEIIARTSNLHIIIENAVICDDDISPDEPKIIILDKLIDEVTKVGLEVEEKGDYANLQGDYAKEQGDYAKSQGDYAKEQKIEVVKANEEANRIINNFETNVGEYTTSFNENANNKTTDFDSNAESKTSDFNQNVDNKISEYNNNASEKLSAYNTNAENKKNEFDTNVANKTKTFNDNASDKLESYNQNDTTKTNTFNDNASNKTTDYNNNATTELNKYNTNASAKLQEYNDNATQKIEEYDAHSKELDNKIVSTRNELERVKNDVLETGTDTDTYIHLEDSAMAEYQELSVDGVCKQETTSVSAGDEYDSPSPDHPQPISVIENSLKITSCNKNLVSKNIKGYINKTSDTITIDNNSESFLFYAKEGERYTRSCALNLDKNRICKVETDNIVNNMPVTNVKELSNETFISEFTGWCIWFVKGVLNDKIKDTLQVEQGSTATDFEQHLKTQITANIPDGEFIGKINDTYKDTLKVEYNEEDGQYHLNLYKNIGKVVLDGSENWADYPEQYTDYYLGYCTTKHFGDSGGMLNQNKFILNNFQSHGSDFKIAKQFVSSSLYAIYLKIYSSIVPTANDLKSWLSTHNVEVYYALATPYVLDLGIVEMPITYNEITNIFTDSDLMPQINAKYYRTFEKTIQNLQVNEKALKQELIDINARLSALESASASVTSESEVVE